MRLLPLELGASATLLLDDPAAELDAQHLGGLIRAVQAQPLQLLVTTLHEELVEFAEFGTPGRRYRIEEGRVRPG
jgi:recombinational DNA repair ATPase RecF